MFWVLETTQTSLGQAQNQQIRSRPSLLQDWVCETRWWSLVWFRPVGSVRIPELVRKHRNLLVIRAEIYKETETESRISDPSVQNHPRDLYDLTLAVVGLHQEAEPVVHIVVVQLTPEGVTEAGRRAKSPVARLSLLPERKTNRLIKRQTHFHVCAHNGLKLHF